MLNTVQQLQQTLQKIHQPRGYYFNCNQEQVDSLLQALLVNKERYGYSSCPCRLASGTRKMDRDIICPCHYRDSDVREYGSCYCGLYVSREWNEGTVAHRYVPERRPPASRRQQATASSDP